MVIVPLVLAAAVIGTGFWLYTPDRPRAALEAKYLRLTRRHLDVAGLRLHVRDSGPKAAPAMVMLHGFGASLHTWEPWSQALAGYHRVIRFDLPGSGLTGPDPAATTATPAACRYGRPHGQLDVEAGEPGREFDRRPDRLEIRCP